MGIKPALLYTCIYIIRLHMHEMQFTIIIVLVLYDVIKKHYNNNYFIDYITFL